MRTFVLKVVPLTTQERNLLSKRVELVSDVVKRVIESAMDDLLCRAATDGAHDGWTGRGRRRDSWWKMFLVGRRSESEKKREWHWEWETYVVERGRHQPALPAPVSALAYINLAGALSRSHRSSHASAGLPFYGTLLCDVAAFRNGRLPLSAIATFPRWLCSILFASRVNDTKRRLSLVTGVRDLFVLGNSNKEYTRIQCLL